MKTSFKIQSGIPIARHHSDGISSGMRETFRKMKVGQSFLFDSHPHLVYRVAKELGMSCVTRKENGSGRRVWRTA